MVVVVKTDHAARLKQSRPGKVVGDVVDLVRAVNEHEREALAGARGLLESRPAHADAKIYLIRIQPRAREVLPHDCELIGKILHRIDHDERRPFSVGITAHQFL